MEVHRKSYHVYTIYLFLKPMAHPISDNMNTHNLGLSTSTYSTLVVTLGEIFRGANLVHPPSHLPKEKKKNSIGALELFLL